MYWQKRFDCEDPDGELLQKMKEIREEHKDYGYRRICGELRKQCVKINKKREHRIEKKYGYAGHILHQEKPPGPYYKGVAGRIAPNRASKRFSACVTHQKITTDIVEFKYYEPAKGHVVVKKLLDPFMGMLDREILSYGISDRPSARSIMAALNEAIDAASDCKFRRTFHSDRG